MYIKLLNYLLLGVMVVTLGGCDAQNKDIVQDEDATVSEVVVSVLEAEEECIPIETDVDTSNWKTYRNEKYGYEIKIPADWGNLVISGRREIYSMELDPYVNHLYVGNDDDEIQIIGHESYMGSGIASIEGMANNYIEDRFSHFNPGELESVECFRNNKGIKGVRMRTNRYGGVSHLFLVENNGGLIVISQSERVSRSIESLISTLGFL